jgi:tetratricopeptide (TPR) repeat protein
MKIWLWLAGMRTTLRAGCLIGAARRAVLTYWHAAVVLLVGFGIVLAGTGADWLWIPLAVLALVMLAAGIVVARRRTIVEEFVDYEADEPNTIAPGVSTLLAVELARLGDLYRTVDDQRPIASVAGHARNVQASIGVGNWTKDLESAVSAELKVKVGPLQVPVGVLLTLLGRLVRGPRIAGGVHDEGGTKILTARLLSNEQGFSWRVQHEGTECSVDVLIKELACRVFTDLSLGREVSWEATESFTRGLSAYRECLRATGDRPAELREAERCFIQASAADASFDLAYYNLGVVYEELDAAAQAAAGVPDGAKVRDRRAKAAFKKAILSNPERVEAYYALALLCFKDGEYRSALELCERIIESGRDPVLVAHAHNLKGLTQRLLPAAGGLDASLRARRHAVYWAVRACLTSELRCLPRSQPRLARQRRRLLSDSLRNLGAAHAFLAVEAQEERSRGRAFRDAERLLRAAIRYSPFLADRHYALGKVLTERGCHRGAVEHYHAALRLAPGDRRYWANLGAAAAACEDRDEALRAIKHAMRSPWQGQRELFEQVERAYRLLGEKNQADRIASLPGYRTRMADGNDLARLERKLKRAPADRAWERAQAEILAANRLHREDPALADEHLATAIELLTHGHREEIRSRRLRAKRAGLRLRMGEPVAALAEAQKALDEDPLDGHVRAALADAYFALGEFRAARQEWGDALAQNPEQSEWRVAIGGTYLAEAFYARDASEYAQLLEQAAARAHQDLRAFSTIRARGRGGAHRLLGLVHLKRGEYHLAVARLRIAAGLQGDDVRLGTHYWLGEAHLYNHAPYDAKIQFERVLELTSYGQPNEIADYGPEPMTRAEFGIRSMLALGLALREQGQPEEARQMVADAREAIAKAREDEAFTAETAAVLEAASVERDGWIAFKSGDYEAAIASIQRALMMYADPLAYVHLATIYGDRLRAGVRKQLATTMIRELQSACRRARELDRFGQFAGDLEQLLGDYPIAAPPNGGAATPA